MNALIIDDNKLARMAMKQLATQVSDLEIAGECNDALEAYKMLQQSPVDILLLDIEMPGMTGLELTRLLSIQRPVIIFTTANKNYAVEAFELKVADYLVKPVTLARFIQAIEIAREILNSGQPGVPKVEQEFTFIRDNGVLKKIYFNEIQCLEAMGDYVKIHTEQRFYVVHATLKNIEEKLPENFLRIHRSYIVAINKIESIQDGSIQLGKMNIPVADAYRSVLNKRLNFL